MTKDIYNAEHPYRKTAIYIIEAIIEPLLFKRGDEVGLEGEEYYETEDKITLAIKEILK